MNGSCNNEQINVGLTEVSRDVYDNCPKIFPHELNTRQVKTKLFLTLSDHMETSCSKQFLEKKYIDNKIENL